MNSDTNSGSEISLHDLDWKKECESIGRELLKITTSIRNGTYSDIDILEIGKRIDELDNGDETRHLILQKLRNAYGEIKNTPNIPVEDTPTTFKDEEESFPAPHQFQVHQDLINEEVEQQHWEAVEREAEISRITNTVSEINDIFHDLDTIVNQQGELIDNIEDNIYKTSDYTRNAHHQLLKAENYQRRKNRCTCILAIIVVVFLLILILILI